MISINRIRPINQLRVEAKRANDAIKFKAIIKIVNFLAKDLLSSKFSVIDTKIKSLTVNMVDAASIKTKLVKVIYLGESPVVVNSIEFTLTANDLINNKLIKFHGLNSVVDVTVFDNLGTNVGIGIEIIDDDRVQLDFQRLVVNGIWKVLIEK